MCEIETHLINLSSVSVLLQSRVQNEPNVLNHLDFLLHFRTVFARKLLLYFSELPNLTAFSSELTRVWVN